MKKTILFLILIISMSLYRPIIHYFLPELETDYATLLRKALQAGTVIAYITINKLWDKVGKLTKVSISSLQILLPVFLLSFTTYLYGVRHKDLLGIIPAVLITLLIGVIEELEFRGVIYSFLEDRGLYAILVSSVIFGLVHMLNLIYQPDVLGAVVQCLFATGFGLVMAVTRYRSGLLLPQILMHALWDLNQRITRNNAENPLVDVIYYCSMALVILWGVFLVIRIGREEKNQGNPIKLIQ